MLPHSENNFNTYIKFNHKIQELSVKEYENNNFKLNIFTQLKDVHEHLVT